MTNYIRWNGLSEDGSDGDKKWINADFTWSDVQLIAEVAEAIEEEAGSSPSRRKENLEKFLKDKDKKNRLIQLVCRIKGVKVYDETKEIKEDINVSVEDVDMLIKEVIGKIKVETKDVL
tara:strand:+ start:3762 stop:4118 length:357 start_codon:yes stop_codon:yes gene_type:complete